jgi:hypothetical protein
MISASGENYSVEACTLYEDLEHGGSDGVGLPALFWLSIYVANNHLAVSCATIMQKRSILLHILVE